MKRNILIVIIILFLIGVGIVLRKNTTDNSPLTFRANTDTALTTILIGDKTFTVEVARTPEEKAQGLSGREPLNRNAGMLFVFDPPTIPSFWMREMKFALDFVWIDENLTVVEITKDVPPPTPETPLQGLPQYSPKSEVRYVLEINAGESRGLLIGDRVTIHNTYLL